MPFRRSPTSRCITCNGDIIVRHPETESVTAAMKLIVDTIEIEYG